MYVCACSVRRTVGLRGGFTDNRVCVCVCGQAGMRVTGMWTEWTVWKIGLGLGLGLEMYISIITGSVVNLYRCCTAKNATSETQWEKGSTGSDIDAVQQKGWSLNVRTYYKNHLAI